MPARPTDRAFLVRVWGELRRIPELPALVIEPRPFVMELHEAPAYGPDPGPGWGLRVRHAARPAPVELPAPTSVMARTVPVEPPPAPPPTASLPDAPEPIALRTVMASLRGRAQRCYESEMVPGRVELLLTVEGSAGRVETARATPAASGTARCIEEAAGSLRFPSFARASITIQQTYTFR